MVCEVLFCENSVCDRAITVRHETVVSERRVPLALLIAARQSVHFMSVIAGSLELIRGEGSVKERPEHGADDHDHGLLTHLRHG